MLQQDKNLTECKATFNMWTRWSKTHPLGQIAHPMQAFRRRMGIAHPQLLA